MESAVFLGIFRPMKRVNYQAASHRGRQVKSERIGTMYVPAKKILEMRQDIRPECN
jgi:hypothetical protein